MSVIVQAICTPRNLEGARYQHRTLASIKRRVSEPAGEGWSWRAIGSKADLETLGAFESGAGDWLLDLGGKYVTCEVQEKPKGKLHPDNFPSFTQWESACAGVYGGVFSQWPEWAKTVLKAHYGYMPKG